MRCVSRWQSRSQRPALGAIPKIATSTCGSQWRPGDDECPARRAKHSPWSRQRDARTTTNAGLRRPSRAGPERGSSTPRGVVAIQAPLCDKISAVRVPAFAQRERPRAADVAPLPPRAGSCRRPSCGTGASHDCDRAAARRRVDQMAVVARSSHAVNPTTTSSARQRTRGCADVHRAQIPRGSPILARVCRRPAPRRRTGAASCLRLLRGR